MIDYIPIVVIRFWRWFNFGAGSDEVPRDADRRVDAGSTSLR